MYTVFGFRQLVSSGYRNGSCETNIVLSPTLQPFCEGSLYCKEHRPNGVCCHKRISSTIKIHCMRKPLWFFTRNPLSGIPIMPIPPFVVSKAGITTFPKSLNHNQVVISTFVKVWPIFHHTLLCFFKRLVKSNQPTFVILVFVSKSIVFCVWLFQIKAGYRVYNYFWFHLKLVGRPGLEPGTKAP